jgi:Methyltransferase domain
MAKGGEIMATSKFPGTPRAAIGRTRAKDSDAMIGVGVARCDTTRLRLQNSKSFLSDLSFRMPERVVPSAWHEHAPFAFWLVEQLKPRMLVELGTHHGFSYFSFCQAIRMSRLSTAAFAVDTWTGDEHAGVYGDEVYQGVQAFNSDKYSDISTLMKMPFANALQYFEDRSVDLLHIDGRHYFEDVKTDFESWLPKLSDRAVVLLHDTNVREREFGVHKFWSGCREEYPNFNFIHGHGLGVLGVGNEHPSTVTALFKASEDEALTASIRNAYARLGSAVGLSFRVADVRQSEVPAISSAVELATALKQRDEELRQVRGRVADLEGMRSGWEQIASMNLELATQVKELSCSLLRLHQENEQLRVKEKETVAELKDDLARTRTELSLERQRAAEQADQLSELRQQRSDAEISRAAAAEEAHQLRTDLAIRTRIAAELSGVIDSLRSAKDSVEKERAELAGLMNKLELKLSVEQQGRIAALESVSDLKSALAVRSTELTRLAEELSLSHRLKVDLESRCATQSVQMARLEEELATSRNRGANISRVFVRGLRRKAQVDSSRTTWRSGHAATPDTGVAAVSPDEESPLTELATSDDRSRQTSVALESTVPIRLANPTSRLSRSIQRIGALRRNLSDRKMIAASGLLDRNWYLENYSDVRERDVDPAYHYLRYGAVEGRDPGPLFDSKWYLQQNPDVRAAGVNPLVHYLRYGALEGRDPNRWFDSDWYFERYPDVRADGINPLVHYLRYGAREGRKPHPLSDGEGCLGEPLARYA